MMDLRVLRHRHPVITVAEFLTLHGLDPSVEATEGLWGREAYHRAVPGLHGNLSLFEIPNTEYDPPYTTRVDVLPRETTPSSTNLTEDETRFVRNVQLARDKWATIDLDTFRSTLEAANLTSWTNDAEMVDRLAYFDYAPLYTFEDSGS